ncbi:TrbL/VirB6 plasmid conjugal transfer protein [Kribbella steppae]|uniref:TrbL/VirB6 plasmid conjugal transfer protein n=1 Tax=Kribbella steppae TaxID=2512223 RepID=A0A4R2HB94_9ACTN|nr:hypothetical protein [Kribbella steppae]TCO24868.1 TrbL/VirB6 plasmid conjugal transfer protein [Kribbella steppae]
MCIPTDFACHVSDGFDAVATNALKELSASIGQAAMEGINAIATYWIKEPSPTLVADAGGSARQNSEMVDFLQSNVLWISGVVFTIAVLIAGMRLAWEQRAQPLQDLLKAVLVFVVASAAGTATMQLLVEWSDELSLHIVRSAHPDDKTLATALGELVMQGSLGMASGDHVASLIMMFAGVAVIMAALIQVVLMVIRSAMLILLAGTFPLAAAATNTEMGKTWFKKYCGWALAFIAYKPAAALIYAAAIKMNELGVGQSTNSFVQTTTGLMMLFLAIFALPALLRFMVPVTAAVAGGSAGMGSSVADPGGIATGAINVGRSSLGLGSRGSGGGGGASGGGAAGGGGGASGAVGVGAVASAGLVAAGAAVNGARKVAGGVAGAAAHSAGESGGGSITPTSSFGPISRGGSRARPPRSQSTAAGQERIPEPAGPSGSR